MSQNTENFESLRHLLALKRHEQPPPGYFNNFSSQIIARIKLGELGERATPGRVMWEAPWLQRIWTAFETKPILAGAFAVAVCGFLITSVIYSEKMDVQPVALIPVAAPAPGSEDVAITTAVMTVANHPLLAKPSELESSSTSPIAADALLQGGLHVEPASFTFPGRN
jgi:hypothetical protein